MTGKNTCFLLAFVVLSDDMRCLNNGMNNKLKSVGKSISKYTFFLAVIWLAGCASTDYQAVESSGPLVGQGQWGTRKVVDGVDIWTSGAPPRKYRVLGVIHDTRGAGPLPMAGYYSGIAGKVKQYGGDAAIEVSSQRQYVGTTSFANATTTTSGGFTGTGYRYGNVVDVTGNVNTTSNTFASGTSVPLFKHHGQFLVVKYL
jgi:hypothetical protein